MFFVTVNFWLYASVIVHAKTIIASGAKLQGDHKQISFVIALSKKVPIKVFTLAKPYRVVIDLPEVKFRFPAGLGRKGRGLVSAYRYGLFARGKSRIVIDAKVPVLVKQAYVRAGRGQQPAKMFIKLVKTTSSIFALNLTKRILMEELEPENPILLKAVVKKPIDKKKNAQKYDKNDTRPMIILDPGHGGLDTGAIGRRGTLEKNVVLEYSKLLRDELIKTNRYRVVLTRSDDTFIKLRDRVKIARAKKGDLFIAIHADSVPRKRRRRNQIRGGSVYILSSKGTRTKKDELADDLAADASNRDDLISGVVVPRNAKPAVKNWMVELAQRETNIRSRHFARIQIDLMRKKVRMHDHRVHSANFRVLKAQDIPSVLIELGFLSSKYDEANLKSVKWRRKSARTIIKAIDKFQKTVVRFGQIQ